MIENENVWTTVWNVTMGRRTPSPNLPKIGFSTELVIAVFMGQFTVGVEENVDDIFVEGFQHSRKSHEEM